MNLRPVFAQVFIMKIVDTSSVVFLFRTLMSLRRVGASLFLMMTRSAFLLPRCSQFFAQVLRTAWSFGNEGKAVKGGTFGVCLYRCPTLFVMQFVPLP